MNLDIPGHDATTPLVHIVDDDDAMRASLLRLLRSKQIATLAYANGIVFLESAQFDRPGCILLDVKMPGLDGLGVQESLRSRGVKVPTIFLTGAADVPIAVAAMRAGAVDFIEKPFENEHLLARVAQAIRRSQLAMHGDLELSQARARLATLTPREREIMALVAKGLTSKEIARLVSASHRTIEIHRRNLMEKLGAETLADLVRMDLLLGAERSSSETR